MLNKLFVEDLDVQGKRVLVRVDFNVPLGEKDGKPVITDDKRILASLPTVTYLIEQGARVILMSHMGRPKGQRVEGLSLAPVAARLGELIDKKVTLAPDCVGDEVKALVDALEPGEVVLLENLRFHEAETQNDPDFSAQLASLADAYVNDAFGAAHRAHASTAGVTESLALCVAGYLMRTELDYLGNALVDAKRPFVGILGGAKISSKITVIESLLDAVDTLLIGGAMSYTFFKYLGFEIGKSLFEDGQDDQIDRIQKKAASLANVELILPTDCVVAAGPSEDAERRVVAREDIPADMEGFDIGPETAEYYGKIVRAAKSVVWNGPMGMFEVDAFAVGTNAVASALVDATAQGATTIIGGGDSAAAIQKAGLDDKVSHVSTGGGASLEFLEGKVLPGVAALSDRG